MKKSEYSGLYGDYSTYSDEVEELTEIESGELDISEVEGAEEE